jgi:hypothetical protein
VPTFEAALLTIEGSTNVPSVRAANFRRLLRDVLVEDNGFLKLSRYEGELVRQLERALDQLRTAQERAQTPVMEGGKLLPARSATAEKNVTRPIAQIAAPTPGSDATKSQIHSETKLIGEK